MATLTNADLGLSGDTNPFSDSTSEQAVEKKESKTTRPASKIQSAASTGTPPPVEAPTPVASQPAPPILAPLQPASAAALPNVQNPATTKDFWSGALASSVPSVLGGLGLAAGGYLAGRGSSGGGGGGGGSVPPPVDEEMRQIKLQQEQAKIDALSADQRRRDAAHYAEQRRADEAHQIKLDNEAKRAEANLQKNQGKSSSPTSADAQATQMIVRSEEAKVGKAVDASAKAKAMSNAAPPPPVAPAPVAPVAPPAPTTAPTTPITTAPETVAPSLATIETPVEKTPPPKAPKAKVEMPQGWGKGMSWLVNQYGVDGAQAYIDAKNNGKPFATYDEMMKSYQENTTRPKFSDIPKDIRKSRRIERAIVPPMPPSGGGMGVSPRTGGGGRLNETGRPGEEIIHNLNPLKL